MRMLQQKLGELQREQNSIDLTLDEDERQQLLSCLQRIVKVDTKSTNNQAELDKLKAKINPNIDPNTANYFHKKFYSVENPLSLGNALAEQRPGMHTQLVATNIVKGRTDMDKGRLSV